ncbi:MAG: hypothetical protein J7507_16090 [Pseudoxanthomonas sp.]|nr:hypothetical protein [Pseudoxanthomonas sp.]
MRMIAWCVACLGLILVLGPLHARDAAGWRPLDPADAAEAAIQRWHRALANNDYAAFDRLTPDMGTLPPDRRRALFDMLRARAPKEVLAMKDPRGPNPNGTSSYYLAGCIRLPGDHQDLRVIASVTPRKFGADWKVAGVGFDPPWNDTARQCPVV